ncbi:MAG TPA: GSCFA domain-containing protein [Rhizomicrobium sp.]|nr:GSCFA domain-containing protein [Rhizomicrobium sp.]
MIEWELEDALGRSARNRAARWPERRGENRLEPECWPELNPRFRLAPGARVFTIGSCFARNVEHHLSGLGFDVPTRRFLDENIKAGRHGGDEILNKYTPPSIFQELAWTRKIMDRDRIVREDDVEPLLLDLGEGRVVDLQHRLTNQYGVTREEALGQRRDLYRLFENAFDSDVVVITLGLIECWFDRKTEQYVEFGPFLRRHNDGGRFVFRRLGFNEAYDFTRRALDLLGARNVLITTSPVPLARTFTADDVIVANAYSKSVLRAVAGQIVQERANVDYFPSYESVMLTRQSYVWADDLTHVDGAFVGRIVGRMSERYVEDATALPDTAALDKWLRFAGLVEHRQFDEAKTLFASLPPEYADQAARLALAVAELQLHLGEHDAALASAELARAKAETAGERGCSDLLRCARIFESVGRMQEAEAIRKEAVAKLGNTGLIMSLIRRLSGSEDGRRIIAHVEAKLSGDLDLMAYTGQALELDGDAAGAQRIYRAAVRAHPRNPEMLTRLGRLLQRDKKHKRAAVMLERALALDAKNVDILKLLVACHRELEEREREEDYAGRVVALAPNDAAAHLDLASAMRRGGRREEALEHARRAAALDPGNERYARYVEDLSKARRAR